MKCWPATTLSTAHAILHVVEPQTPSSTKRGIGWLSNFEPLDKPFAQLLVDSLRISGQTEIRYALKKLLVELANNKEIEGPVLLLTARKMVEFEASIDDPVKLEAHRRLPVAFDTFYPGANLPPTPGSEGFLGNLVRDLSGSAPDSDPYWLHPESDLPALRSAKCRSIVLVTDYAGSGTQITRYADALLRSASIRSWRSGKILRIYAASFAASDIAVRNIARNKNIDRHWIVQTAPSFRSAHWTNQERGAIERLCSTYAQKERRPEALGYNGSTGLFTTDATIPNNLPVVLRQTGHGWHPFFDERKMPTELAGRIVGYGPPSDLQLAISKARQPRLGAAVETSSANTASRHMAIVLAIASRGTQTDFDLAVALGAPLASVKVLTDFLRTAKLLDDQGRTTPEGLQELAMAKRLRRHGAAELRSTDSPYYPEQLR
jgi:hypothetical protein